MVDTPSLQPRQCDECSRQMMVWEISTSSASEEQETTKDITQDKVSLSAFLGGKQERTIETTDTEGSKIESGKKNTVYLCPDPTCENHLDGVRSVVAWKLMNASPQEYSDTEINQRTVQALEQSIHDFRIVSENVENIHSVDTHNEEEQSTNKGDDTESSKSDHTDTQGETTSAQQLGSCKECGEHLDIRGVSIQNTTSEQNLDKNSESWMYSFTASSSLIPFKASGGTGGGDESTSQEKSSIITANKAAFPICSNKSCEEYLIRCGQIECWRMRNDDTHEYSAEDVDSSVIETLKQEVRYDRIATNAVEDVHSRLLNDSSEPKQQTDTAINSSEESATTTSSNSSTDTDDSSKDQTGAEGGRILDELLVESADGWDGKSHSEEMDNRKDDDDKSGSSI